MTANHLTAAADLAAIAVEIETSWDRGYWPTLRVETKRGHQWTPSCATVELALELRRVCVASGRGYFDGSTTIGRTI